MSRVFFRFSAMNSGKTTQLLQVRHNYLERDQRVLLLKTAIDTREGVGIAVIKSRLGIQADADALVNPTDNVLMLLDSLVEQHGATDCVLVDEAQFLTKEQVGQICEFADLRKTPVMCFGLRSDFRGDLFPGAAALFALADRIEELKTVCWCGSKATMNARLMDGKVTMDGPQIQIGGEESYVSLCRAHWRSRQPRA